MQCGNCGHTEFEIAAGHCYCTRCSAEVSNEVAAALHDKDGGEDDAS